MAIEFLIELCLLDSIKLGDWRTINANGISPSAREIADAVKGVEKAGYEPGKIEFRSNPEIQKIIDSWPTVMRAERAEALGMPKDSSIAAIIRDYLQEASLLPRDK
jgi:hypothetical protein